MEKVMVRAGTGSFTNGRGRFRSAETASGATPRLRGTGVGAIAASERIVPSKQSPRRSESPMSAVCFAAVLVLVWGYLAAATLAAWRFSRRSSVATGGAGSGHRPVSVLKPLHGAEPGLYENLRSFADQDYPAVQIVLGVRDPGDGALPIARALIRDRPDRDIALVVNPRVAGSNLKVANLENMLPAARHDWIVLADSDMRVDPRLPVGRHRAARPTRNRPRDLPLQGSRRPADCGRSWRRCRSISRFLPGALVGDAIKVGGGCFGATIALRRDVLDRIGGFARLRDELADDHRIGEAVRGLGLEAVLSPYIVENRVTETSLAELVAARAALGAHRRG